MKKTILLLALVALLSNYCLANDNKGGPEPTETEILNTEAFLIHAIDCTDWIDAIPDDIHPFHLEPADQLELNLEELDFNDEFFHFNYLLYPCSDEACFRQASLRFRQLTGHKFGEGKNSVADLYTWRWCISN